MKALFVIGFLFSQVLLAGEVLNLNATYQVPVPSEKFAPYATFEITNYQIITNDDGSKYMSYTLPEDLTGEQKAIIMPLVSDVDGKKSFAGEQGTADCTGKWIALECSVKFENLNIKQGNVIPFLVMKYGYNQDTKNRIMVSRMFSNDPIGFVKTDGKKEETPKN